ncbi:MAG: endonuclease/exonuclease/phosphatase family protein [Planctomycetaceae bacterium]
MAASGHQETKPVSSAVRKIAAAGMQCVRRFALVATVCLTGITVLTIFAREFWLADLFANLRVQWVIGLAVAAVCSMLTRRWKLLAVQLAAAAIHAPWLAPAFQTPAIQATTPATTESFIRVTTANAYVGNRRYEDIEKELVRFNPDVIAVVELSVGLRDHLAGRFSEHYPHSITEAMESSAFGIGLYSRIPFDEARIEYTSDRRLPGVVAQVTINQQRVRIVAAHTFPPMFPGAFRHRNKHLQMLAARVRKFRTDEPNVPVLVMGDLNLTPWSPVFSEFIADADLVPSSRGRRPSPTWYRLPAFPFGLVLDHILTTDDLTCTELTVGSDAGSDHRFVTAEFALAATAD